LRGCINTQNNRWWSSQNSLTSNICWVRPEVIERGTQAR
jgi:hypothetical protein